MKLDQLTSDTTLMSIISTLIFNIMVATLYIIAFWLIKKFCSKTANEKAD